MLKNPLMKLVATATVIGSNAVSNMPKAFSQTGTQALNRAEHQFCTGKNSNEAKLFNVVGNTISELPNKLPGYVNHSTDTLSLHIPGASERKTITLEQDIHTINVEPGNFDYKLMPEHIHRSSSPSEACKKDGTLKEGYRMNGVKTYPINEARQLGEAMEQLPATGPAKPNPHALRLFLEAKKALGFN